MRTQMVWLAAAVLAALASFTPTSAQDASGNFIVNGGFEDGVTDPWNLYGDGTMEVVTELVGAAVPEDVVEGSHCLHVVVNSAGTNFWDTGLQPQGLVFEAGKQYTLSAFMKSASGDFQVNIKPELAQDPWTGYGAQAVTITEEWAEYSVTTPVFTEDVSPAGATYHIGYAPGEFWIDAVRWYEGEYVPPVFVKQTQAEEPSPEDNATDVLREPTLSWSPGPYAAMHDVYFGESFDDVNSADTATPGIYQGQQAELTFDPGVLEWGQTYYWRIDEVNDANSASPWKGNVWSFTVEPYVYPVQNIIATASSSDAGNDPADTINGSGLGADDLHSVADTDMWLSQSDPNGAWIQYEFDEAYKLTEMWVWNYNVRFEPVLGYGFKEVTVEISTDGENWTVVAEEEFAQATAEPGDPAGTILDMDGAVAQYVRLRASTNWSPVGLNQFGLSEVRFYHLPVRASGRQPAAGATDVDVDAVLSWRPGREAGLHEVQFGTDMQAVADGTALLDSITETSYAPDSLNFGTQYYWQIVEVNDAETPAAWESGVWDFTTAEYMVVDDFESYTNESPDRVFQTWVDGWGFSADDFYPDGDPGNGTGATAGHDIWTPTSPHYEDSIMETVIVNTGRQALPMYYDNTSEPFYSEVERTFAPAQDWTANGADTLKLAFRGNPVGFVETAPGTVTMSGAGDDIYQQIDEFRFAYKRLTGDGSITVKVESIENTHEWAKAGVMIRAGLEPQAQQVHMIATPSNRVEFMHRPAIGANTSAVATEADSTPLPVWVRLTRSGNTITGEYSADGVTWTEVTGASSVDITMIGDIYVGLAVTSNVSNVPASAEFSNVQTAGGASGQWQVEEIGVAQPSNDRSDLYVVVTDSSGRQAMLVHPDPDAVLTTSWTDWVISIDALSDAGINPTAVSKMAIGVGNPLAAQADGSGLVYVDDVMVGRPVPEPVGNLLVNGGFEDGVLEPWYIYDNTDGGATAEVVTDDVIEGQSSLHIVIPAAGANFWDVGLSNPGYVYKAGRKYTLSVFLKCKEGTLDVNIKPELGADPWSGFGDQVVTITDEWAEYSVTTPVFTEDTSPGNLTFHIGFEPAEIWVDGVRFYEGDYTPPEGVALPGVNLLTNGGFEDGVTDPWTAYGDVTVEVVQELTDATVPEAPIEGDYCLYVLVPTAAANFWDAGLQPQPVQFQAGKTYTFSAFLKSKQGALEVNFKPELAADPWTAYGEKMFTITEEWAEYTVTTPVFTEDVDPSGFTFHIGSAVGGFWIDGVRFYEGDYVPAD